MVESATQPLQLGLSLRHVTCCCAKLGLDGGNILCCYTDVLKLPVSAHAQGLCRKLSWAQLSVIVPLTTWYYPIGAGTA